MLSVYCLFDQLLLLVEKVTTSVIKKKFFLNESGILVQGFSCTSGHI